MRKSEISFFPFHPELCFNGLSIFYPVLEFIFYQTFFFAWNFIRIFITRVVKLTFTTQLLRRIYAYSLSSLSFSVSVYIYIFKYYPRANVYRYVILSFTFIKGCYSRRFFSLPLSSRRDLIYGPRMKIYILNKR